jgi:hypothetical protein
MASGVILKGSLSNPSSSSRGNIILQDVKDNNFLASTAVEGTRAVLIISIFPANVITERESFLKIFNFIFF